LGDHIAEFRRIANEKPPQGLNHDALIAYLNGRAARNMGNMTVVNSLIQERLRPLLNSPEQLNAEVADALFAFSQRLFTMTDTLDAGLALEIHQSLLSWAGSQGDVDRIVLHAYWAGMVYQQCDQHLFKKEAAIFFAKAAAQRPQYTIISKKETRQYINRSLGNIYTALAPRRHSGPEKAAPPFFRKVDEAIRFWNDEAIQAHDPDFPWRAYISNAHQNVCGWVDVLMHTPMDKTDHALAARVYESSQWIVKNGTFGASNKFWPPARLTYMDLLSRYFTRRIDFTATYDGLMALYRGTADDDYSEEGMYCRFHLPTVIMELLRQAPEVPRERRVRETDALISQVINFSKNVPDGVDRHHVVNRLGTFVKGSIMKQSDSAKHLDLLLRFTAFGHMSTYVHSIQVKNIAEFITCHVLQYNPGLLTGLCGAETAADVAGKAKEIMELIRQAGLCHDIGKIAYANTVAVCSRKLYEYEFSIIKDHVNAGANMRAGDEMMRCVKDVITGHHKWYDGQGGYPGGFDNRASPFAAVIDIISVADSIDAATDAVGRSYASAHTLDHVVAEIRAQAGTRYSPAIAEALGYPALLGDIRYCINQGRKNVYYQAYVDLTSQDIGSAI